MKTTNMVCVLWWPCGNGFWESSYARKGMLDIDIDALIRIASYYPKSYLVIYEEEGSLGDIGRIFTHWYVITDEPNGTEPRFIDGAWRYEVSHRTVTGTEIAKVLNELKIG